MSIIESIKKFIQTCPHLDVLAKDNIHIDLTSKDPTNYGIASAGDSKTRGFIDGSQERQASFVLYANEFTLDDVSRLENNGFCEDFAFWIEDKNTARELPTLDDKLTPQSISASNGILFDLNETGDTGTYQIQIQLIYRRS